LADISNSEVVSHVLTNLMNMSSRKTTQQQAYSTMSNLIKKFQNKYDFLKNIEIKDTRFLEMQDPISVMSGIDTVESDKIGKALHDIIKDMNKSLGKDAGHFFIKELRTRLDKDYATMIENMGLDLGLMQLEFEVNQMTKKL
jgi:hypothetical protein